jgi:nitrate/TMAO reductase-like tetraheme cytochrome c subunit
MSARKLSKKWKIAIIVLLAVIVLIGVGGAVVAREYLADNPEACGTCHAMEANVQSYLNSNYLDSAHAASKPQVKCEGCHQQSVLQQAGELISTVRGNYTVSARDVNTQAACTSCHPVDVIIAAVKNRPEFVADPKTSYHLNAGNAKACRDPRAELVKCQDCHKSHDDGVNYCATCHTSKFGTPVK